MSLSAEWSRLLDLLSLPPEPAVLVAAPDSDDVMQALAAVRPRARVTLLDVTPQPRPAAAAPVVHRIPLIPGRDLDLAERSLDLAVFDHAIDDIVVEAVAHHEGIHPDPQGDRGQYSPRPRAVRAYWRSGDLEAVAAPALIRVVQSCLRALRPSGRMVFHHHVAEAHLVAGHPFDLYTEYLPLARRWIAEAGIDIPEIALDSFDQAWWMCLERAA
ncbi:MAG: hypothetical protein MUQ65_16460 [Armatimonadetes bacterium]|nr:hypothetical protein [Armatimonadota bacterium]